MTYQPKTTQARRYVVINDAGAGNPKEGRKPRQIGVLTGMTNEGYSDPYTTGGDVYMSGFYPLDADHCVAGLILDDGDYNLNKQIDTGTGIYHKAGDVAVTASGTPDKTHKRNPNKFVYVRLSPGATKIKSYGGYPCIDPCPDRIKGEGIIANPGSGNRARYTFQREGANGFQFRATPNYYGRVPEVLAREPGEGESAPTAGPPKAYIRPKLLPLANGNLLAVYLNGGSVSPTWTYQCTLPASAGGTLGTGDIFNGPSGERPYAGINNVRMQLMVKEGMTWTCPVKYYQTLPKDAIATELGSENMQHVSGHDIVQYPDTGEILYISAGWLGTVLLNMGTASGFVCVDTLLNDCDTIDSFTTYNAGESGAYDVVYDNPKFVPAHLQGAQRSLIKFSDDTADVPGVSLTTQILALSAEVLPSGRLVVMVATRKQLVSLVSDDRGVTFRGSVVMDLTFNGDQNYEQQRWLSLDTCVDRNGKMLVLVVGQGLGDRRNETLNQGAADAAKTESLCSVFVTADGEDFGTEKRLGYGPNSDLLVSNPNIPPAPADPEAGYWQLNDLDDAVHCLSGSISMLPNGYICAQVITLQYGSPTGTHAQWVAQCVFSTQDVSGGDTDADIAKALNKVIHERGNPVQSRIGRFVPSMIQYGRNHYDTGIGNTAYSFLRNAQVPGAAAPLTGVDTGRNWGQTAQTIVSAIDPSNNGWISFGGLARTGGNFGTNNERFGGGPVFLNGPVDIAQTLYRDRMISMVCWYYEAHPSDFPGYKSLMESTYRHDGTPPPAGVVEYNRSVAIYQSAHLQPLNVRIPSQLKAWAPLICPGIDKVGAGIVPKVDKVGFPVAQDKLYNGNTSGWSSDIVGGIDRSFLRGGVFAGNTFSVAWDASNDPVQQMWDLRLAETGATAQYRDSDAWDRIVNGCWETYHPRGNGYYGYYMYPGQFTFQNQDAGANIGIKGNSFDVYGQVNRPLFMPNPMSLGMTSYGIDTGGVNKKDYYLNDAKGGLGFVCRFVFMPIAGTEQYNSSYTNNHPVTGVEVRLCKYAGRTGSGSTSDPYVYKFEKMIVGLDAVCETLGSGSTDTGKVNLYMLVNGQRVQNAPAGPGTADATIELEFDPLPAVEAGNLPPVGIATPPRGYVEVVFGMKEHETQPGKLHAFFYAREWKRGQDPDFIADFKYDDTFLYNSPMITFEPGAAEDWNNLGEASTGFLEYIKMGHIMASSGNERDARWKSLQFARSFLEAEPCNASLGIRENNTLQTIRNPTIKDFAMDDRAGDTDHELFRFLNEPAMQQFQVNESGVMCPMRPPLATANPPQMIDRGLEIQMRGRASTPRRFEYEAKSRFDPMLALSPPISYGYRGSKQTAQMQVFSGTDNVGKEWMHYTPAAEISYDFGEDGVRLSSIAAFGVNNPSVILEFTNKTDPDSGEPLFYANLDPTPSETTIVGVCPPCDPWVKATMYTFENLMSGGAATFLMRTRYLFYGQYVQPGNSLPSTLSDTDYNISFSRRNTATVQNKVTFTAKGYDARYGAQPFTPHQFRSEQGESYYLTIYTREGFNPSASNVALTHFGADDLGVHKHVFKIADNSSEALYLTSDDANIFGNYFDADSGNNSGLEAAAWCITSDRFGLNVPEKIMGRTFRYMRVRFSSAVYHDPNEKFHTLAYLSTGPKMDMSNRDFDWGWSVNAKTGNTLTTSRTGQRRSRRNHKARRTFTVKYTPKPEVGTTTQPSDSSSTQRWDNATSLNIQNPKAGYGQFEGADSAQDSQVSVISRNTWHELVDRVMTMGMGGEVFALGFDAYGMTFNCFVGKISDNYYHNENVTKTHPVLSDPRKLIPARLVSYGGASHRGYYANPFVGPDGSSMRQLSPEAVVEVGNMDFEEEL